MHQYSPKLGINLSMVFTEVPLIKRFELAAQAGFEFIEIQFPYELSIEKIKEQLHKHQLKLCLINVPADDLMQGGVGLASTPQKQKSFKAVVQQAIEYATVLNIPNINVLSGRYTDLKSWHQAWECFIENLQYTVKQCEPHSIQVLFEMINGISMPNFLVQNTILSKQVLEQVPQAKLQFDTFHVAMTGADINHTLQQFLPHIGHIQIADYPNRGKPSSETLDFTTFSNLLKQHQFTGYICGEYLPTPLDQYPFEWKQIFK